MTRLTHATPAALLVASAFLAGCTVGPDRKTPPSPVKADSFASLAGADVDGAAPELKPVATSPATMAAWWTVFRDPVLDSLVARAVAGNQDLRIAAARVREARALRGIEAAARLPSLDAKGSAAAYKHSTAHLLHQLGVIASPEPHPACTDVRGPDAVALLERLVGKHPDLAGQLRELFAAMSMADAMAEASTIFEPTSAEPPALAPPPAPGSFVPGVTPLPASFDDYELLEEVGRGVDLLVRREEEEEDVVASLLEACGLKR
jgi:hypothetical protein